MPGVALSSLRVTSDFDATAYTRGAQQKVDADARMIASDKALNAALAQSDAALAKIPGGMASVSKSLLDGYGAGQQFEALIRRINNAADRGMGLDRVNLLLDAAYRKFGLTADAANLAATGYVSITAAVKELNEQYEIQNEVAARAAAAMAQVSTAAAAQASINARLGVGGGSGKSAQESADAFLAQFGGLEGIARAKAQEAGNAFAADLDARMVAGAGKSARDSANAFDAELSRLDEIAGMRAQQAGTNFQRSLTEALGGGGGSATSRGATFSALEEQFNRLEAIAAAKSAQIAQATQQGLRDAFRMDTRATDYQLPDAFGKTNVATVSALEEMAKAEEKAAAQAAALRAEINPLEAEMVKLGKQMAEYRKMLDQGLISSSEFEQAQGMAAKRLSDVDMNMRDAATGGRVLSGEMANLGYQVNDVVTGLMLGQPLFMIAAQQGGQVYQIFSRSKASVGEFAGSYLSSLTSMVTPTRAVFGGIAAVVTTAAIALNSYLDKQHQVSMSLLGSGRGSGASAAGINGIANAAATPNGLSVSEAREFASSLVQTGKIANDNLLPIVQIGKDITRIYGIDATEAAKMLADAFADPEKGATELNNRLGFLDAGLKRNIDNLVAQNKLFDAQKALLAGVKSGLTGVSEAVSTSSTVWTVLGNAVSNAWDATGAFIAKQIGLTDSLEEKIARARQNLDELRRGGSNTQNAMSAATGFGDILGIEDTPDPGKIAAAEEALNRLVAVQQKLAAATDVARAAQQSFLQESLVRGLSPEIAAIEKLNNDFTVLDGLVKSIGGDEAAGARLAALGLSMRQVSDATEVAREKIRSFKTDFEQSISQSNTALQAITAFSPSAKGGIAYQQSIDSNRNANLTASQKQVEAELAYQIALKQATTAISEQGRVRLLTASQSVQSTQLEADLVGKSIGQQAELRANLQARQQLEQEASANRTAFDQKQYEDLKRINAELGRRTDLAARAQINQDIKFGSQTALPSPDDVQIAQQLKGIYPDVATALGSVEAQGLRTNQALSGLSSTISGQLTTGLADIVDGSKSIGQGFQDMSRLVIRAIEEMIIKIAIIQPMMQALQMGANSLGLGSGITSLFGGGSAGLANTGMAGSAYFGPVAPSALGNVFSGGTSSRLRAAASCMVRRSFRWRMAVPVSPVKPDRRRSCRCGVVPTAVWASPPAVRPTTTALPAGLSSTSSTKPAFKPRPPRLVTPTVISPSR
ncbi:phage tail length tape measure family protein [Bradyrhizobium liaoningense]|uniref:phage tail length tape measure family protein n=1 Tax=Bradyrhizobium liaoningense TaxID=43992 RepID=UPI001BA5AA47|nr:phage tail length tape measure family protein [Bradyrhizobium liaoningense]